MNCPFFFDIKDADGYKTRHGFNFSKRNVTAICRAFLDTIKPLDCGVYASYSCLQDYIDWRSLGCAVWNAQWGYRDDFMFCHKTAIKSMQSCALDGLIDGKYNLIKFT